MRFPSQKLTCAPPLDITPNYAILPNKGSEFRFAFTLLFFVRDGRAVQSSCTLPTEYENNMMRFLIPADIFALPNLTSHVVPGSTSSLVRMGMTEDGSLSIHVLQRSGARSRFSQAAGTHTPSILKWKNALELPKKWAKNHSKKIHFKMRVRSSTLARKTRHHSTPTVPF